MKGNQVEGRSILLQGEQLVAQNLTQPAELRVALVLQAELERLLSYHAVHLGELDIVSQNLENVAVCLPEKLEPWRHQLAICPVLVGLVGYVAEHEILGALLLVQVVNLLNNCLQGELKSDSSRCALFTTLDDLIRRLPIYVYTLHHHVR